MEVSKNRGVSKGSTGGSSGKGLDDDHDYYTKTSGRDSKHHRNPNSKLTLICIKINTFEFLVKKNWIYDENGKIVYISTGFVGHFDKTGTRSS